MPRALLVTYEFPPMGGVGVQRPFQFAKQLPAYGVDVTVVTVDDPPAAMRDESLLHELPVGVDVQRAWSLEPTRLIQLLRRSRRQTAVETSASGTQDAGAGVSRLPRWAIRLVQAFFVPDEKRLWRGRARRTALKAIRQSPVDAVISSGPPYTAHLIGRDVSARTGLPWIADFRDPWVGNYFFVPPTPVHALLQSKWERRVVASASRVLVVSEPMAEDLRCRHPDQPADKFVVIPNGFDTDELPERDERNSDRFTVCYLGAFQGDISPNSFIAGLRKAGDQGLLDISKVRFLIVGPSWAEAAAAAAAVGLTDVVEATGYLPHAQALSRAAGSDVALLVLTPGPESRPIVTGKLPEYLGLGLPVLALAPGSAAASIVRRAGAGSVVPPDDVDGVAAALGELYGKWSRGELPQPDPTVVAEFDRSRQMAIVAEMVLTLSAESAAS